MQHNEKRWQNIAFQLGAVILAFLLTALVVLAAGAPPLEAFKQLLKGAFGTKMNVADTIVACVPLLLATSGLLVTFAAGLWNIGVEGQIVLGSIFTTWILRSLQHSSISPSLIIALAILGGMLGGGLWATLAGLLKTFGGVNEIFGGLGLNFIATSMTIWLIFGPWKRPGVGSMSGTEPFPESLWLPTLPGFRLSLWSVVLGVIALVVIYFLLQGTYFGLKLKAVGNNPRAAYLLGIPTWQYMLLSFFLCGLFAGLAGSLQVVAVYHRLIPSISSGYGYIGLMVAMLINYQALWIAPIAFFFASLNIGSIQLPIAMKLDSSLSGVIQGSLVLVVMMAESIRHRLVHK